MLALSGYAEWMFCMCKNWKDVENRNWSLPRAIATQLPYRIYLHASRTPASKDELAFISTMLSPAQRIEFNLVDWTGLRGKIIGETTITKQMKKIQLRESDHVDVGSQQRELELLANDPCRSRWFFGIYGFVVKDGVLYDKPIPYKGQLGFFKVSGSGGICRRK